MNTGRFVGAAIAVWIIRTAMNATFYGLVVGPRFEQVAAAHPGMFRTVIPAYVIADLIFAVVFTVLFTMVAGPLGGGVRAGITLGFFVALLAPVLGGVYEYYSVTYLPTALHVGTTVYQAFAHIVQGIVAGAIYKTASPGGH